MKVIVLRILTYLYLCCPCPLMGMELQEEPNSATPPYLQDYDTWAVHISIFLHRSDMARLAQTNNYFYQVITSLLNYDWEMKCIAPVAQQITARYIDSDTLFVQQFNDIMRNFNQNPFLDIKLTNINPTILDKTCTQFGHITALHLDSFQLPIHFHRFFPVHRPDHVAGLNTGDLKVARYLHDRGVKILSNCSSLNKLKYLCLKNQKITNQGILSILRSPNFWRLEELIIIDEYDFGTRISVNIFDELKQIPPREFLRLLRIKTGILNYEFQYISLEELMYMPALTCDEES